ncbi:MAG: hypothetical protein JO110_11005 [Acetobacteraceae bacterium]|nr:hypothetical protein [Acetobacteraceae bacterium]
MIPRPVAPAPRVHGAADFELARLEGLPQPFRLPRGFGWLMRLVPGAAAYGGQLQDLLADPGNGGAAGFGAASGADPAPAVPDAGYPTRAGPLARGREPTPRGVVRATPIDGAGLDDMADPDTGTPDTPPRAIPPASPAEPWPAPPVGSGSEPS